MANLVQKAVSNIKAKASQLLNNLDRDKSMSGFQLAQGGLGNKISQGIQSWQAKPSNQMWNSFANNTPQVGQAFTNWANKTYSPTSSPSLMNPLGKYNPLNSVNRAVVGFTGNQIIQPALDIPKNVNIAKDPTKGKLERGLAGLQAVGGALPGVDDAVVMGFLAAQNKLAGGSLEKGFTGEEFTGTGTLLAKNTALETPLNFAGLLAPALAGKLKPKQLDEVLAAGKKVDTPKLSVEPTGEKIQVIRGYENKNSLGDTISSSSISNGKNSIEIKQNNNTFQLYRGYGTLSKPYNSFDEAVVAAKEYLKTTTPSKPLSVEPVKLKAKNLTNDQQLLLAARPDVKLLPGGTVYVKNASQARKQLKAKMPGVKVEVYNPLTPGTKPLIPYTDTPFIVKDGAMAQRIRAKFPTAKIIVDNKLPGNAETIMMAPPAGSLKMTTLADVEQMLGLEATGMKQVGTEGVGGVGGFMRGVEDKLATTLGRATTSESPFIRAIANGLRGFSGGLTKTQEYLGQMAQFKGGQDYSNYLLGQLRQQTKDSGMKMTDLENIWKSLDPELAGVKASDVVLTPKQKEFADGLRVISDYINDLNYQNGFISQDNWLKNRGGKYIARAYEAYDMPDEIVKGIEATNRKLNLDGFMKRLGITEWKQKEAIKDPVYLVSKRLQETMFNDATTKFFKWVRNQQDLVSDNPGPGFVRISDHKAYGDLAGKFVRKDVLEDIRGLFSTNDTTQKIMDLLNTWDRLPPRQWRKKILTVWNPATRLGNATGNYVFSMMSGIDPVTFASNKMWAKNAIKNNDVLYRQMIRDGVVGVDAGRGDIVQFAKEVSNGVDDGILKKTDDYLKKTYSQTDEIAKVAAMKTWLDKGLSYEEAAKRVMEGFQNYRTTGWLYDIAAKTPIFGNAFIRFAPEFIRIAKNSATRHPVAAISMLSAWIMMERMGSMMSGETAEDRQTRITRPGAARLPFTNIPLSIMIGDNEVNVSRFVGMYSNVPFSGTSEIGSNLARISPFLMPEKKNLSSDVAFGPLIAAAIDTDFRGKSIQDPNATKYMPSTLTPEEKRANVLKYLAYQYAQPASQLSDVAAAFKGEPDFYGRTKTPVQALLRTYPGVKVEKFGPEQAAEQRAKTAEFQESANDQIRKQITSVKKQLLTKKIDQETADKRIQYLQGQIKTTTPISGKGTFDYIRESDGSIQSIDTTSVSKLPESTGYEKAIKEQKAYSLAKEIINNLPKEQQAEALASIGIDEVSAIKYTIGSQDNDIKTAYVTDQIPLIESQAKTRNDFLVKLAEMREEVGGKMILANGVIDNLVDEGVLTYNEGRMLKKLEIGKTPTGKKARVKVSGRGTGAKLKVSLTPISKLLKTTRSKPKRFAISKERAKKIML